MKNKMGIVHKFAYSFFDFTAYKEFVIQGLGKAILYCFLITLIFTTITNIKMINLFNSDISSVQATFEHSAPNFELKNGVLSVDNNEPVYYKHDELMLIVDTSGKTSTSVLDSYNDGIYIDSNSVTFRQNYKTIQTLKLSDLSEWNITNAHVKYLFESLKLVIPIVLLIITPIASFLANLISIFAILAPFSLSVSTFMGVKLSYTKACTLSCYAITLPLLLEALLNVSGINIPDFYVIFYIIAAVYCGLAIKEIKNKDKVKSEL